MRVLNHAAPHAEVVVFVAPYERGQLAHAAAGTFRAMAFGNNPAGFPWGAPRVLTTARNWPFRSCAYYAR